jgi:hypothetical protein
VSLDNEDYDQSTSLEERYVGDRFADRRGEMILQTAVRIAEQHKNLPPEDAERFAFTFKELNEKLANRQNEKLKSREEIPAKFPEPRLPAKLTYLPGRKRALIGREVADQQEADDARARCKAERIAIYQAAADSAIDKDVEARTQLQEDAATVYLTLTALENRPSSEDENEFVDIDDDEPPQQSDDKPDAYSQSSDGDNLPDIKKITSQHGVMKATQSQQPLPAKRV